MLRIFILSGVFLLCSCGQSRSYVDYSVTINVNSGFSFVPASVMKEYREDERKWEQNSMFQQIFFWYLGPVQPDPIVNGEKLEILVDGKGYRLQNGENKILINGYQGAPVNLYDGKLKYGLFNLGDSPRVKVNLGPGGDLFIYAE